MKKVFGFFSFFITMMLLSPTTSMAQFEVGIGYLHSRPSGMMNTYINRSAHGISLDLAYRIPKTGLSVGFQFAESGYGHENKDEMYRFDNGYEGIVNVEVCNNFSINTAYLKYDILDNVFAQPYLLVGAGFSNFSTDLTIMDPREVLTSDCPKPLETTTLLRDRTTYMHFGGGLRLDMSYPFKTLQRRKVLFDLRFSYMGGGDVSYMNLNKPNISPNPSRGENIFFDFASAAQPEVIHEYHAGSMYRSRMQFFNVNAGLFIVIGDKNGNWAGFWDLF